LNPANTEPATVVCTLAGYASCRAPAEDLGALRRQPGTPLREPWPVNFLKHVDDQAVVGLSAVLAAIAGHGLVPPGATDTFRDWGVLAAPRFLGRPLLTAALPRFQQEGAWGVSPHLIPHHSLHSISGTVSQALEVHGPNFGVGGGPGSELEALLAGVALLDHMDLPGVWLVFTRLDPEGPCDPATGRPGPGTDASGLALALTPAGSRGITLELRVGRDRLDPHACTLDVLEEALAGLASGPEMAVSLGGAARLVLRRAGLRLAGPHAPFFAPQAAPALASQRSDHS
jgi:hypothetical protein